MNREWENDWTLKQRSSRHPGGGWIGGVGQGEGEMREMTNWLSNSETDLRGVEEEGEDEGAAGVMNWIMNRKREITIAAVGDIYHAVDSEIGYNGIISYWVISDIR